MKEGWRRDGGGMKEGWRRSGRKLISGISGKIKRNRDNYIEIFPLMFRCPY